MNTTHEKEKGEKKKKSGSYLLLKFKSERVNLWTDEGTDKASETKSLLKE